MKYFSHSGDLGDIIYSLPAIKAAGGGVLRLFDLPGRTAHGMTQAKTERLKPLLLAQSYIHGVEWHDQCPDHNLNGFRDHLSRGRNLADAHLSTLGYGWNLRSQPWIRVPVPNDTYKVIFSKSQRYENRLFPWARIVRKYQDVAAYVGFPDEHQWFCRRYGKVPLAKADDFLELASLIAGCKLFIGNQSSPAAIAHGLKSTMIQEVCPGDAQNHCVFQRINCLLGWDEKIELPEIEL